MESLDRFPRPNVAIDLAVLTVLPSADPRSEPGQLAVLVQDRADEPSGHVLPGRFLREGETIDQCIATTLREKLGIEARGAAVHLLRVFDSPDRDPRGWTISIAHYLALPHRKIEDARAQLVPLGADGATKGIQLLFDHAEIVRDAASSIRGRYELEPDPDCLVDAPFTLADLRHTHDAVLGAQVRRDTFRRRFEPALLPHMVDGQQATRIDGGRPARLWETTKRATGTFSTTDRVRLPREK